MGHGIWKCVWTITRSTQRLAIRCEQKKDENAQLGRRQLLTVRTSNRQMAQLDGRSHGIQKAGKPMDGHSDALGQKMKRRLCTGHSSRINDEMVPTKRWYVCRRLFHSKGQRRNTHVHVGTFSTARCCMRNSGNFEESKRKQPNVFMSTNRWNRQQKYQISCNGDFMKLKPNAGGMIKIILSTKRLLFGPKNNIVVVK